MKLLVAATFACTLVACSGAGTPTRSRVQAALVTSGISKTEARCATRQLFTVLSTTQLRNLAERGSGALDNKTAGALSTALGTCASNVGPARTVPATSTPATTSPQTAPLTSKP